MCNMILCRWEAYVSICISLAEVQGSVLSVLVLQRSVEGVRHRTANSAVTGG